MEIERYIYIGAEGRQSLYEWSANAQHQELIIFVHGFMGFMDWGAWPLVQNFFTKKGYDFCRFNLSHNGGTPTDPIDFPDTAAFGKNTYSKETFDISSLLDHLETQMVKYLELI